MAKTSNAKQAPEETTVAEETQTQTEAQAAPDSINLSDLGLLLQIVDLATQRGAFKGNELSQVGAVFDKLNTFLAYVQQQQEKAQEAEAEGEATTEE